MIDDERYNIFLFLVIGMSACSTINNMTTKERTLITDSGIDIPFRVLKTDSYADSLFLRKKCEDVSLQEFIESSDWQHFLTRLKLTMIVESGVGIAAPQVGVGRNVFVFRRIDKPEMPMAVAINPKITNHSKETICFEGDGCLSVPNRSGTSRRYSWVDVEYYNAKGEMVKERLSGYSRGADFTGIIFQHEFDHLQGILFTDKLCD